MEEPSPRLVLVAKCFLFLRSWEAAETLVAALEQGTEQKCPCCTKQVLLCTKHYRLHHPGAPCNGCANES